MDKTEGDKQPNACFTHVRDLFFDKRFVRYTWVGIVISVLNVFLLWLFIDVLHIQTVISSAVVIGATFIIRYLLYVYTNFL